MMFCDFFFFQAEDGIRDVAVTGVQTCALPICRRGSIRAQAWGGLPDIFVICSSSHAFTSCLELASIPKVSMNRFVVVSSTLFLFGLALTRPRSASCLTWSYILFPTRSNILLCRTG